MNELIVREDMLSSDGNVLLKANTPYYPRCTECVNDKDYFVYDTEIDGQEILLPCSDR